MTSLSPTWLALAIGNSRLHWASFEHETLHQTWQTPHLDQATVEQLITHNFDFQQCGLWRETFSPPVWPDRPELWLTSVVPQQTQLWQRYGQLHAITLAQVPMVGLYPTLGSDRAIALWGAIVTYGSPVLVIDGGTALTFTGATGDRLVGGAILPGLQLQFRTLGQSTAALPLLNLAEMTDLPPRWALDTPTAMRSGIIHSAIASIYSFTQDWLQQFPNSSIILTGGDGAFLHWALQSRVVSSRLLKLDQQLIFWGMRSIRERDRIKMAHLKPKETRHDAPARKEWKFRLTRRLYEQGYERQDILNLFRFIDWIMELPEGLKQAFRDELEQYEQEQKMPYVTSIEQMGMEKGMEKGREEERQAIARNLLRKQFPLETIAEVTGLTIEQLQPLQAQISP